MSSNRKRNSKSDYNINNNLSTYEGSHRVHVDYDDTDEDVECVKLTTQNPNDTTTVYSTNGINISSNKSESSSSTCINKPQSK